MISIKQAKKHGMRIVRSILDNVGEDLDAEVLHADDEWRGTDTYDTKIAPSAQLVSILE